MFLAELELAMLEGRRNEATGWIVVCVDDELGKVTTASGPFASPEEALVQAGIEDNEMNANLEPGEKGWTHSVAPLFAPGT